MKEITPARISKLHILVHPGFLQDPATDIDYDWNPIPETDSRYTQWDKLLSLYTTEAEQIPLDEIVIVMLHARFHRLLEDLRTEKRYTATLRKLKRLLGRRMVALSGDNDIESEESFELAAQIARARGYEIPNDVESVAYGETVQVCVPEAADTANRALQLKNCTRLNPALTDDPQVSREDMDYVLSTYTRIKFGENE